MAELQLCVASLEEQTGIVCNAADGRVELRDGLLPASGPCVGAGEETMGLDQVRIADECRVELCNRPVVRAGRDVPLGPSERRQGRVQALRPMRSVADDQRHGERRGQRGHRQTCGVVRDAALGHRSQEEADHQPPDVTRDVNVGSGEAVG